MRHAPAGAMVFYTLVGPPTVQPAEFVDQSFAPKDGEWVYQRGPDKFLSSPLEQRLKDRGIKTVIVTGTSAQGVVIGTGSGAAQRAATRSSCRSTACRPRIRIWSSTRLGTCTKAGPPSSPI
jgi:hypothetical protein